MKLKVPANLFNFQTTLDVFLEMEHLDLINETNLIKLEEIFNLVCPVLNQKIDQYKAGKQLVIADVGLKTCWL